MKRKTPFEYEYMEPLSMKRKPPFMYHEVRGIAALFDLPCLEPAKPITWWKSKIDLQETIAEVNFLRLHRAGLRLDKRGT